MPSSSDIGLIVVFMTIVFALASWFTVSLNRYYDQYGLKVFFWVFLVYGGATFGVIYAANSAVSAGSDVISPYWYILCAGIGLIYTAVGASIVSKPIPQLPPALHPTHIHVRFGVTHGLIIEARGFKPNPDFVSEDVRLHVEGDAFWSAVGTFVSSSLISMAQMTLLPLQLVPMYLPAKSLARGSNQFQLTISIGSKQNGQKGLGFQTIRTNLQKLAASNPTIYLRFHTPPNQPLFTLEATATELIAALNAPADAPINLWRGGAAVARAVADAAAAGIDIKVPDGAGANANRSDMKSSGGGERSPVAAIALTASAPELSRPATATTATTALLSPPPSLMMNAPAPNALPPLAPPTLGSATAAPGGM